MSKISFLPADHFKGDGRVPDKQPLASQLEFAASFFSKKRAYLTYNARQSMTILFNHLNLKLDDEVYIATTFALPNVSSCVTCTIFNHCRPSRVLTEKTKAIFIIHEFGALHPNIVELRKEADNRNIPLIEDCAHTINSNYPNGQKVGYYGDWVILSFPKIFPVEIGGMLIGNQRITSDLSRENYVANSTDTDFVFQNWRKNIETDSNARRRIFALINNSIKGIGLHSYIYVDNDVTPWFFPLEINRPDITPLEFISKVRKMNIDCGLWHGSNVVVLPLHQYITTEEAGIIVDAIEKSFSDNGRK